MLTSRQYRRCVLHMCVFFRVTLLDLLCAQLREEDSEDCGVPSSVARFMASAFQKGCGAVLALGSGSASSDEVQTLNLTDVSSTVLRPLT